MNGEMIGKCKSIDISGIHPEIEKAKFTIACDVNNSLLGPNGATYVYGKQKGANNTTIAKLEENMKNLYDIIESALKIHVRDKRGAGAAGGLGAALMAFLNAELKSGIEIVLKAVNFNNKIKEADIIFTGEGKIDRQTLCGKTISGILKTATKNNVPVIAITGKIDIEDTELHNSGIRAVFSICPYPMSTEEAMKNSSNLITWITEQICRVLDCQPINSLKK
jgi:glycerate kinase